LITKTTILDGVSWLKLSDIVTIDSSVSEITGNRVVVVASTALPHPFKKDQYLMTGAVLDSLYVRSVDSKAALVVTPGLDLGY